MDTEDADYKIGIKAIQAKFVQTLTASDDLYLGLTHDSGSVNGSSRCYWRLPSVRVKISHYLAKRLLLERFAR